MITTKQVGISITQNLDSVYIESELMKLGIEPLRWAIVEITDEKYLVSVSYSDKCFNES